MNNDYDQPRCEGPARTAAITPEERLARLKRASLREQALEAAWRLGALVRRVEHEAPEVHGTLHHAVAALRGLCMRLGRESADEQSPGIDGSASRGASSSARGRRLR